MLLINFFVQPQAYPKRRIILIFHHLRCGVSRYIYYLCWLYWQDISLLVVRVKMENDYVKMEGSLVSIASELFRFQKVFEKAIKKLEIDERNKYMSQYAWFSKKVLKALDEANFKIINIEGQLYDPGMAVTPLNIDEFEASDQLLIAQMIEPIIMKDKKVYKTGTVILGRVLN